MSNKPKQQKQPDQSVVMATQPSTYWELRQRSGSKSGVRVSTTGVQAGIKLLFLTPSVKIVGDRQGCRVCLKEETITKNNPVKGSVSQKQHNKLQLFKVD